jgi:hypothetical protein
LIWPSGVARQHDSPCIFPPLQPLVLRPRPGAGSLGAIGCRPSGIRLPTGVLSTGLVMRAVQDLAREGHQFRWGERLFEQLVLGTETIVEDVRTGRRDAGAKLSTLTLQWAMPHISVGYRTVRNRERARGPFPSVRAPNVLSAETHGVGRVREVRCPAMPCSSARGRLLREARPPRGSCFRSGRAGKCPHQDRNSASAPPRPALD